MEFSFLYDNNLSRLTLFSLLISSWLATNIWLRMSILLFAVLSIPVLLTYHKFSYWEREGMPFIPLTFPFGYLKDLFLMKTSLAGIIMELYAKAGNKKYVGVNSFAQSQLLVKDIDLIKTILVKDFNNFVDRGFYVDQNVDPLTGNLFSLGGQAWKNLRAKISPVFTSGKLKTMYLDVKKIANELKDYALKMSSAENVVEIKDLTGRYGLEVISSIALGLEGNNFHGDHSDMKRVSDMFTAPSGIQVVRSTINMFCRDLAKLLQLRVTGKDIEDYFFQITRDTIKYRRDNNIKRNDFLHLLMNLEQAEHQSKGDSENENNKGRLSLTITEMAAQSFVFVVAGYETTSITLCFLLHELALNPDVQERLIAELDSVGPDVQYEELLKLPYLEMVLNETLRKHPPVVVLQRESTNNYQLPDGKVIKAGTVCLIPVIGMHRDPKLFPDPDKFDPERFNKDNIKDIKPYSYIPFGEGPRICIGNRFAYLQLKLALLAFFSRFKVALSEKTPLPLKIERKTFLYNSEGGLWLRLIDRNK